MNRQAGQDYVQRMTTGHHENATSNHYNDVTTAVDAIYDAHEKEIVKLEQLVKGYETLVKQQQVTLSKQADDMERIAHVVGEQTSMMILGDTKCTFMKWLRSIV